MQPGSGAQAPCGEWAVSVQVTDGGGGPARAPRSDALRNRALLVDAATSVFGAEGVEASLEEVARKAGVGIGTLYRHFPTRDALVLAVYRNEVNLLCARADELLAELPPGQALAEWMQRFIGYVATKRGMASVLKAMMADNATVFEDCRTQMMEAARKLLEAAAEVGAVRADIGAADLVRAMGGICLATDTSALEDNARPLIALLLDGLRFGAPGSASP